MSTRFLMLTVAAISLAVCPVSQGRANTIFSGTGQDIFNSPNFSFPTRPPSLNGTVLNFGPGAVVNLDDEVLFRFPLFPAGTFAQGQQISISITMELLRASVDFDPAIAVSDGSSIVGFLAGDNLGGDAFSLTATDAGTTAPNQAISLLFDNAGYPNVGSNLTMTASFGLGASQTSLSGAFEGGSGANVLPALDKTQALSLVFLADDHVEAYGIVSLTAVTVVPEPTTLSLLAVGLIGLTLRRRSSYA